MFPRAFNPNDDNIADRMLLPTIRFDIMPARDYRPLVQQHCLHRGIDIPVSDLEKHQKTAGDGRIIIVDLSSKGVLAGTFTFFFIGSSYHCYYNIIAFKCNSKRLEKYKILYQAHLIIIKKNY